MSKSRILMMTMMVGAPVLWADDDIDLEYLEVERVQQQYWAQGEESELGVVQNRLYSKDSKLQVGLLVGVAIDDPFLSTSVTGMNFTYNFSEFWGVSLLGWKYSVSDSNALKTLKSEDKRANTVAPDYYIGSEVSGSFMYGKLSLLGYRIVYYDMHFLGNLGTTATENDDSSFTVGLGIGQRFYVNEYLSLRMDYRMQTYTATVREKEVEANLGNVVGTRRHYNHVLGLEVNFMFGVY